MEQVTAAAVGRTPPAPAGAYRWYVAVVLFVAYSFSAIDSRVLTLLVVPIKDSMALTDFEIGVLQGFAFALLYSVACLPIGRTVDRTAHRGRLMTAGVAFWSLMTTLCGFATGFWTLFAARVGVGVGEATLSPSAYSVISDYFDKTRRALAISIYAIGYPIGGGLALIIGGGLLTYFGGSGATGIGFFDAMEPWQKVFVMVGLPGVAVAALLATIREPARRETGGIGGKDGVPVREAVRYIAGRWRLYGMLIGVTSLSGLLAIGVSLWYPTFLVRTYGLSVGEVGLYYGLLMLVCGTIGTLSGGVLSGVLVKGGREDANLRITLVTTLLKAGPLIIGPLMPTAALALGFMAVATLIGQAAQGVLLTAIQDVTPNRLRGQVTAVTLLSVNVIGLGLGSTIIASFTDFLFRDDAALRYSIVLTGVLVLPAMVLLLVRGMGRYRVELQRVRAA